MEKMSTYFRGDLAQDFTDHRLHLQGWLRHAYPRAPFAIVEESVSEAYCVALEQPQFLSAWQAGGTDLLHRYVRTTAWRQLRAHYRSKRRELPQTASVTQLRIEGALEARSAFQRVCALIPAAAKRFGGKHAKAMESALRDRIETGVTDVTASLRWGVQRAQLNRARRWILSHLEH